ncbi:hypothetical protein HO133_000141 [Letharia lupina]|uniref:Uncharacterized protein n=1 Tax=Letharia lupina TaxID=560253 RepID=A0A8H6CHG2_9LECA|nr:uncharacterized protein HO133_000141 [Letharia lupina]KAF6223299.1 hypothetical protein HO133_000141 [Letharia lupina]
MDRFIATSTAPRPDWPLPLLPSHSLINVPKERKRHCRLLPADMVYLSLKQMADAADHEEQKKLRNQRKKLDFKEVEFMEQEFQKWADECQKLQKKKKSKMHKQTQKKIAVVEPNSFDEMIDSVDTLLSSLTPPTTETSSPTKTSNTAATTHPSPPTASTIQIAELDACETAITKPSLPTDTPRAKVHVPTTTAIHTPPPPPITFTTALHSNPPTRTDLAFARNLSTALHSDQDQRTIATKPQPNAPTLIAVTHHGRKTNVFKAAIGAMTRCRGGKKRAVIEAAVDVVARQRGKGAAEKKKGRKERMGLSFSEAVDKGFRGVFGEERGW